MDIHVEEQFELAGQLRIDIRIDPADLDLLLEQAWMAVAGGHGVNPEAGENLADACTRVLGDEALELATNAVMNMAAPFGRDQIKDVITIGEAQFLPPQKLVPGEPFRCSAVYVLLPQAELTSYDPVEIQAPPTEATDAQIDEQIQNILAANAVDIDSKENRPVANGDSMKLSLHTTMDGAEIPGLCFESRPFTLGQGAMPDEFEASIIGMQPGDEKEFDFQGIADFDENENPIMKTYHAKASVLALTVKQLPALTNEWVAHAIPGCKTVDQLRESIRTQITQQMEGERRHYVNYLAASALAQRFEGRIPDAAYEAMRDEIQEQQDREAMAMGLTREQYMEQQGVNEEQHSIRMILQCRERLSQCIALDAYARHFKLKVKEKDLDEFFEISSPQGQAKEMRRQLEGAGRMYLAYENALRLKANEHAVKHAIFI